tara:strand:+ start:91761 stop:92495 length:735 start_codon:yes stop_codon:yes gene_type:complete
VSSAVLSTQALISGYEPDMPIINGVDLTVSDGEFVVLLGPNGAGKSTLVKTIAGLVPVHSGRVTLKGNDITEVPPHRKLAHGLAFVPQTENIFATMTIRENLQLAAQVLDRPRRAARIDALLDMFPDLGSRPGARAGALSGGQRQMLAVARALIIEPSVLILDEPSAGLSPKVVTEVFAQLRRINAAGVTTVLVEQNVKAGLQIATRGVILVEGRIAHDAPAEQLLGDPVVSQLYLGGTPKELA